MFNERVKFQGTRSFVLYSLCANKHGIPHKSLPTYHSALNKCLASWDLHDISGPTTCTQFESLVVTNKTKPEPLLYCLSLLISHTRARTRTHALDFSLLWGKEKINLNSSQSFHLHKV